MNQFFLQARQFDINVYQQKKTLAQGMMDIALLSANANQLRYVLELPADNRNAFFHISLTFIILSLIIQVKIYINLFILNRPLSNFFFFCNNANENPRSYTDYMFKM